MVWTWLCLPACLIWLSVFLIPWRPWSTREQLHAVDIQTEEENLNDITVLIPARNEAEHIQATLQSLKAQDAGLKIILVDDQSDDGTAEIAESLNIEGLTIIQGKPLPEGWSGKLWALHQGLGNVKSDLTLLLDADIKLCPGILLAMLNNKRQFNVQLISLMAELRMQTFWEKLLMPAFIYFFKMVYPFALANNPGYKKQAAAAGGCILLETDKLKGIGGFESLRDALIDDCTLAKRFKDRGYAVWLGLTHSVVSMREYPQLKMIWEMVARTAFTQLKYSFVNLLLVSILLIVSYWLPVLGIVSGLAVPTVISFIAYLLLMLSYIPTLRFYKLNVLWAFLLPVIATLFLAMTWSSALGFWQGRRSFWKGRRYISQDKE